MKLLIAVTILFSLLANVSYSQDKSLQKPKKISSGKDDNCMIQADYGRPLGINAHQKGAQSVSHGTADYIQFNEDKTFSQSINGKVSSGTWTFDSVKNTITVLCEGTKVYTLTSAPNGQYQLTSSSETFQVGNRK